jgi:hypothetical protein
LAGMPPFDCSLPRIRNCDADSGNLAKLKGITSDNVN